ncbi:MAG: LolA family protein [Alphaproteobacteria bacterium]
MLKKVLIFCFIIFLYNKSFSDVNTDKIINYLSSFDTLKSNFIQVNSNGDILTGKVALIRPGKFRVEYNEISVLIISDGRKVAVINRDIKNISFYSLKDLPASMILFKDISLNNIHLLKSKNLENRIEITFSTNKKKDDEKIHITFEKQPLIMKKWEINRLDNNKTEIMFNNLLLDNEIDLKLFDIEREDPRIIPWKN